jgi:hypothetical protein
MRKSQLNRSLLIVIMAVFALANTLTAQNYKEDMLKIRTTFRTKCHSFSIKYLYFPSDSIKKATDSIKGTCLVDSEYWYYKIRSNSGLVEYLRNEKYYVVVNHGSKVIMIDRNSIAKRDIWSIGKVDSLLQLATVKIRYKDINGKGEYDIKFDSGQSSWNRMKLVFNKEHYTLDEIWLYSTAKGKIYGENYNKPAIGIFYTSYNNIPLTKGSFSEEKFLQKNQAGKFEGVGDLKEFKLLDYVNKKT